MYVFGQYQQALGFNEVAIYCSNYSTQCDRWFGIDSFEDRFGELIAVIVNDLLKGKLLTRVIMDPPLRRDPS